MDKITEDLTWILGDFKVGRIDFGQTILKINAIYARAIGAIPYEEIDNFKDTPTPKGGSWKKR